MKTKLKGALRSKTIKFNAVIVPIFAMIEQNFGLLQSLIGNKWYGVAFMLVSAVNIYLRSVTTESLETKGNDKLLR